MRRPYYGVLTMTEDEICTLVDSVWDGKLSEHKGSAEYAEGVRLYREGVSLIATAEHGREVGYYEGYANHGVRYDALISGWHDARRQDLNKQVASAGY